ncbi:probable leucine-rich repeat receptor-like protein kinase At1g68400 [Salvia splendens]|uniref:probable leucine-rich repeat receptor-like protein kinase At1g68400 n=1 Tax=Salvia splendens TaxID=180675 RepID=UPI001C276841|nr:probable leucine-rich repeat receptor-like protein kinase At1g68400 [Salvia splendens]
MKQFPLAVTFLLLLLLLLLQLAKSEENLVRDSLLDFFSKLSNNNNNTISGWNSTSDPCTAKWRGVTCDKHLLHVQKINLAGVFDPRTLCLSQSLSHSLSIIIVAGNSLRSSQNFPAISNCSALTYLDISSNNISASLPDLSRMNALTPFLAQQNNFSGEIPDLDFTRFRVFNVSHNRLSGLIPVGARGLPPGSFLDNPELCGPPLTENCSSAAAAESAPNAPPPPPQVKNEGEKVEARRRCWRGKRDQAGGGGEGGKK